MLSKDLKSILNYLKNDVIIKISAFPYSIIVFSLYF